MSFIKKLYRPKLNKKNKRTESLFFPGFAVWIFPISGNLIQKLINTFKNKVVPAVIQIHCEFVAQLESERLIKLFNNSSEHVIAGTITFMTNPPNRSYNCSISVGEVNGSEAGIISFTASLEKHEECLNKAMQKFNEFLNQEGIEHIFYNPYFLSNKS